MGKGGNAASCRAWFTPEATLYEIICKNPHKNTFPHSHYIYFYPTNKSPSAHRGSCSGCGHKKLLQFSPTGVAVSAIPTQHVHMWDGKGLGPLSICFSTEPDRLPGGQSHKAEATLQRANKPVNLCTGRSVWIQLFNIY